MTLQIHLRHLVGGRARSYTGALPHEHIFQVDFPERPGALRKFLGVFSPDFLITLFHYRKTGWLARPCSHVHSACCLVLHLVSSFITVANGHGILSVLASPAKAVRAACSTAEM